MTVTYNLPETLKEQLANAIVSNFLVEGDIVDSLRELAVSLTRPYVNPANCSLLTEVSERVNNKLAEFFTEVDSELPSTPTDLTADFNLELAKRVFNGDEAYLTEAFCWWSTPQGFNYWEDRASGAVPLSKADNAQLAQWIVTANSKTV